MTCFCLRFASAVLVPLVIMTGGCGPRVVPETDHVIKAPGITITPSQFSDELNLKLTAYPFALREDPAGYNEAVLELASMLSEEAVMLAAARESNLRVTPAELATAEAAIKDDYPEDSFEQMLLENAISYPVWKARLEKDLLVQKVVQVHLVNAQVITPQDVVNFYGRYTSNIEETGHQTVPKETSGSGGDKTAHLPVSPGLDEAELVRQLRLEKSQTAYDRWIETLTSKYPVQVNKGALARFLMDTSIKKE